jgi:hypothetical protein
MNDQMRAEFEQWAVTRRLSTLKYSSGDYISECTFWALVGWQASRAALLVELPKPLLPDEEEFGGYQVFEVAAAIVYTANGILQLCRTAIQSAGVSVK